MLKGNRDVLIISYKQILCQVKAFNGNLVTDKINYRNGQWRSNIFFINILCVHLKHETHEMLYLIFYAKWNCSTEGQCQNLYSRHRQSKRPKCTISLCFQPQKPDKPQATCTEDPTRPTRFCQTPSPFHPNIPT